MVATPLGEYLRTRRAQVTPDAVGLVPAGVRRVPGLRREEVALLAGMSADYYVRLEQGRERNPSAQVLEALAAVLRLDDDARMHLFRLAGAAPRPRAPIADERLDPQLAALLDSWPGLPAIVLGRAYDVLGANRLGAALGFAPGTNLVEKVFGDPASRTFYADWTAAAANTVAGFRVLHGQAPDAPRVRQVLTAMLDRSPEFAEHWARHDARGKGAEHKRLVHPDVGALDLHRQSFDVRSAPGQQLVVYGCEPGSETADRLELLGIAAASRA